jgi:hypothetical protein
MPFCSHCLGRTSTNARLRGDTGFVPGITCGRRRAGARVNDRDNDRNCANHPNATFVFVACAGATVASVTSTQLSALNGSTTLVTVAVGGNDVGFESVLTRLGYPDFYDVASTRTCLGLSSSSRTKIDEGIGVLNDVTIAAAKAAHIDFVDPR